MADVDLVFDVSLDLSTWVPLCTSGYLRCHISCLVSKSGLSDPKARRSCLEFPAWLLL